MLDRGMLNWLKIARSYLVLLFRSLRAPKEELLVEDTETDAKAMSGEPLTVDRPMTETKLQLFERFVGVKSSWGETKANK